MSAGLAILRKLADAALYARLETSTATLLAGLRERASAAGVAFTTTQVGSMFGLYFNDAKHITRYADAMRSDAECFKRFFHAMLKRGVYLAPSAFEAGFVSTPHGDDDIVRTLGAPAEAFAEAK